MLYLNETDTSSATKVRYSVLAAVFVNVVINYMDRSNISVAASVISKDLNLSTVQMGYIFSAFGWTYATLQIPVVSWLIGLEFEICMPYV